MDRRLIPHVPRLLEPAVRTGQFTPAAWARIAYGYGTDPTTITAEAVDHDLRALWPIVYPDRPYPSGTGMSR